MKNYKIIILQEAQKEILEAKRWYGRQSIKASKLLTQEFKRASSSLKKNPYRTIDKNKHQVLIMEVFPYLIFYSVDEKAKTVIISCFFHTKQHPDKYPASK